MFLAPRVQKKNKKTEFNYFHNIDTGAITPGGTLMYSQYKSNRKKKC